MYVTSLDRIFRCLFKKYIFLLFGFLPFFSTIFSINYSDRFYIKTFHNTYVRADKDLKKVDLSAVTKEWEQFYFVKANDVLNRWAPVKYQDVVYIKSNEWGYLKGDGKQVSQTRISTSLNKIVLINPTNIASTEALQKNVAFKAPLSGLYLSAEKGLNKPIQYKENLENWEKFTIIPLPSKPAPVVPKPAPVVPKPAPVAPKSAPIEADEIIFAQYGVKAQDYIAGPDVTAIVKGMFDRGEKIQALPVIFWQVTLPPGVRHLKVVYKQAGKQITGFFSEEDAKKEIGSYLIKSKKAVVPEKEPEVKPAPHPAPTPVPQPAQN